MNFPELVTTGFGTRVWLALGHLPPAAGHALARLVTSLLYWRKRGVVYRTLYANQSVVLGSEVTSGEVDLAVKRVLTHAGMTSYDLVRTLASDDAAILRAIEFPPSFYEHMEAAHAAGCGVIVCGAHLSNFNLGFLAFGINGGIPIQVLSAPVARGGFQIISSLRQRGLFEETPISGPALRQAIARLRQGGTVLTGLDWPGGASPDQDPIPFFGRPARLPTGHIRLAMSSNAMLLPLGVRWTAERGYTVMTAPPVKLELSGDREQDVVHNTRRLLAIVEEWIRETPDQWLMYHPVWPRELAASGE